MKHHRNLKTLIICPRETEIHSNQHFGEGIHLHKECKNCVFFQRRKVSSGNQAYAILCGICLQELSSLMANFKFDRGPEGSRMMDCLEILILQTGSHTEEREIPCKQPLRPKQYHNYTPLLNTRKPRWEVILEPNKISMVSPQSASHRTISKGIRKQTINK